MDISEFNNLDYFVFIIIAISCYFAYKKGFIESFIDFFAWVGSAFLVFDNYTIIFEFLNEHITSKFLCGLAASLGIYIVLVVSILMFSSKVINLFSKFIGSPLDKFLGVIFGFARGFFVAVVIFWSLYMAIYALNDQKMPEWVVGAKVYKPLKMSSDGLFELMTSAEERETLLKSIARKSNSLENEVRKDTQDKNEEIKDSIQEDF